MLEVFNQIFISYGLVGLFILMFLNMFILFPPSEIVLPLAGFFAYSTNESLILVIIIASLANLLGTYLWYFAGVGVGYKWLFHINYFKKRIEKKQLQKIFNKLHNKHPYWIGIFRIFPMIRTFVSLIAGMTKMPHKNFLIYSLAGIVLWVSFWTIGGYYLGIGMLNYRFDILIILATIFLVSIIIFKKIIKNYFSYESLKN